MSLRRAARRAHDDDRGAALITVIGVAAVLAIVCVAMFTSSIVAASTSGETRAGVQAQAAAEQAIDLTLRNLNTTALRGSEASFPCSIPTSISTPNGTADVVVSIRYSVTGNPAFVCPAPAGATIDAARFTARSEMSLAGATGYDVTRVVQQELETLTPTSSGPLFGFGVFSGGDLETTNNFKVVDGGVHTNGQFRCNSQAKILGPVTAVGNASITNDCEMDGVWTGGSFTCSSTPQIFGDVISVGTASLTNTCFVDGSVLAGGSITSGGWTTRAGKSHTVTGSITSSTGSIVFGAGARIAGNAQSGTTMSVSGSTPLTTIVSGARVTGTPTAVPPPPDVVTMPKIHWSDLTPAGTSVQDMKAWIQTNAVANGAPTWSDAYKGTTCTAAKANYSINGKLVSPAGKTVLDARTCDVTFQGNSASDPIELQLREDLTIVAKSFTATNGIKVTSTKPGPSKAKLRIIVPLPAGASTCSGAGNGAVRFMAGGTTFASNVETFLYTNGTVQMTNDVSMHGSVYGCTTNFSVNSTITYADMTPPGMNPPPNPLYEFQPLARYDLNAG